MTPIYKDPAKSTDERVEDLLSRMTLAEKFSQLRLMKIPKEDQQAEELDLDVARANLGRMGQMYNNYSMSVKNLNRLQKWAVEETRLGIPIAIHGESLHGLRYDKAPVFPQVEGLASSFDRELVREIADETGREAKAAGFHMTYAPNLDLSRDPRWGRVEENFGEDPYLTGEMGVTYIRAFQAHGVTSCPKHYAAHGTPERGLNKGPVHIGPREFRELMLPPFARAIKEAKAGAVMPAYSEWDGVPVHASRYLLTEVLREELGFQGVVVSDYGALEMLHNVHKVAENEVAAGKTGLWAGVDAECRHPYGYSEATEAAVRRGEIPEEWVDRAVRCVLRHKFEIGLFEHPYLETDETDGFRNARTAALALRAARESVVLLKNEGDLLPLSDQIGKIALVGPNADNPQLGDYTVRESAEKAVTLRRALTERLGEERVLFARGCSIADGSDEMMEEALAAIRAADAAVLVLGDNSNAYGGVGWGDAEADGSVAVTCGEGFDTDSLDLPGRQEELLEKAAATGKPVILILETGRPYAVLWASEHVPAILQAWYPGEEGGTALAEILFGDFSPCGRLPVSFPKNVGQIPCCYNHKPSSGGHFKRPGRPDGPGYAFRDTAPLYRFGHGLSYTTFEYGEISLSRASGKAEDELVVSVPVKNTGKRASGEAVLLYVTDEFCRVTPFVEQLKGFEKIFLAPGEETTVRFTLRADAFAFVNEKYEWEVEPGFFTIRIGEKTARYEILP